MILCYLHSCLDILLFSSLHTEFVSLQDELRSTIESAHEIQEKNGALLDHVRRELATKAAEVEELKLQVRRGWWQKVSGISSVVG